MLGRRRVPRRHSLWGRGRLVRGFSIQWTNGLLSSSADCFGTNCMTMLRTWETRRLPSLSYECYIRLRYAELLLNINCCKRALSPREYRVNTECTPTDYNDGNLQLLKLYYMIWAVQCCRTCYHQFTLLPALSVLLLSYLRSASMLAFTPIWKV